MRVRCPRSRWMQIYPPQETNQQSKAMNSVNLIGRVGNDIELRYTPSGKAVTEISLAVDDGWGENKKTAWIGVTVWGQTAEIAAKYVRKGDQIGVSGRLSQEEWEGKDGKKQRKTKVTCDHLQLPPKRDERAAPASRAKPEPEPQASQDDDEIPF
jgi:single-strand DNA-binding protein